VFAPDLNHPGQVRTSHLLLGDRTSQLVLLLAKGDLAFGLIANALEERACAGTGNYTATKSCNPKRLLTRREPACFDGIELASIRS